ncbi:AAA-domain-containing protein [Mollisia scopiformis]|uniref:AAA-domain-containing protein n=1 Tax=Mollisia scopiformis TaxID=149040 RepID=A0A194WZZ8_MOLSC|nr:AAA-domain-containing protein [Mollisia scopiformis]KUJ13279.1 AAA-domain-containing protein [Mollisia scopiformis]
MHATALRVIRTAHSSISRRACRIIGGARYPLAQRSFHRSAISYNTPDDSKPEEGDKDNGAVPETSENKSDPFKVEAETESGVEPTLALLPRVKNGKPGSGRIRGLLRSKAPEGVPPIILPSWFWEKNIKLVGEADISGGLTIEGEEKLPSQDDGAHVTAEDKSAEEPAGLPHIEPIPTDSARYSMHGDIYKEVVADIRAGLILRPPKSSNSQTFRRPVTVLQCPKEGGSLFLDSIVETVATRCEADLICLDAQDIAQIVGPYIDEDPLFATTKWQNYKTSTVSYKAHKYAGRLEEYEEEPKTEKEEEDVGEDEKRDSIIGSFQFFPALPKMNMAQPGFGRGSQFKIQAGNGIPAPLSSQDQWNDLKLTTAFDAMITSADAKRAASSVEIKSLEEAQTDSDLVERPLIVQIKDYRELQSGSQEGLDLIPRLRACVDKRWQEGRSIVLVGTTAMADLAAPLLRPAIQHLQSDVVDGDTKTILVTPKRLEEIDVAFETDEKARTRSINIRHVEDMILRLAEGVRDLGPSLDLEKDIDTAVAYAAGIEDAVWTYSRVHRIATTIVGLVSESEAVDGVVFSQVLGMLSSSDDAKFAWATEENALLQDESDKKRAMDRIAKLRKRCSPQESRLLSGVVFPPDIRTTFADIRAPPETVEALKTLTSLSLTRPEAFRYGVLATDKIPGLLLYGPPGTGKTLLAKAVAKESGATVLEVTAADLNDMYVGQGEKNVRAVFSLAKKLSPCVVFIDEADAIFAARHEGMNRSAHREMINQFLREWDGLTTDTSAFIMVATNRPFDIDEAVLRRLPRRILVDLPVEKDREAILKLHLRDEILDESISLEQLAKDTLFYSGSDLKNLSVAAALACIREENELAAKHTGEEPFTYPEKRILTKKHFDKATEEISASISEDMSTLSAIRKFDEKYGDRKGRRKKGPGLGFGGTKVEEKDSEAVRVRKMGL